MLHKITENKGCIELPSHGFRTLEDFAIATLGAEAGKIALECVAMRAWLVGKHAAAANRQSIHQERVQLFMELAGQEIPSRPTVPSAKIRELRVRLLLEEVFELAAAVGIDVCWQSEFGPSKLTFDDLVFVTNDATNIVEAVDAFGDISVVNTGGMLAFGVADVAVLEEIDASNSRKFGPGGYRDEHGKWIKPPDFIPPDVAKVLEAQGWIR